METCSMEIPRGGIINLNAIAATVYYVLCHILNILFEKIPTGVMSNIMVLFKNVIFHIKYYAICIPDTLPSYDRKKNDMFYYAEACATFNKRDIQ